SGPSPRPPIPRRKKKRKKRVTQDSLHSNQKLKCACKRPALPAAAKAGVDAVNIFPASSTASPSRSGVVARSRRGASTHLRLNKGHAGITE
ncbi:unnamed protein product, partial [Tuber aestivum]